MVRNLDFRSEVAVPIYDSELKAELKKILDIQFSDNTKSRILDKKQKNKHKQTESSVLVNSHDEIYKYFKNRKSAVKNIPSKKTKISEVRSD